MDQSLASKGTVEAASPNADAGESREKLEQSLSSGANWFYWIAGLSFINSLILLFGGGWNFVVGLGVTQLIDAVALAVAEELGSGAGLVPKAMALVGDALVAGVFLLLGVFAGKRHSWAFVTGMVLYALDGLLFVLVADWLSAGFHAFALFFIFGGFLAHRKLAGLDPSSPRVEEPVRPDPITP